MQSTRSGRWFEPSSMRRRFGGVVAALVLALVATMLAAVPQLTTPAEAAPGDGTGYITIHEEAASEDVNQTFNFTVSPAAGGTSSFQLNDNTSIAQNINVLDVAVSQDATQGTQWATDLTDKVYYRLAGTSQWQQVAGVIGSRITGGATPTSAFVISGANVIAINNLNPTNLAAPTGCTLSDVAGNGTLLLAACSSGELYRYTGSFTAPGSAASWTQVTGVTGASTVDLNAANKVITAAGAVVSMFTLDPATNTTSGLVQSNRGGTVTDVAVGADGTMYAIANVFAWSTPNGTTWTHLPQTRLSTRMAAGAAGRAWVVNPRSGTTANPGLGTTLFSRNADNSFYDDERVKTSGPGNTVELPVSAGTYTFTQAEAANWDLVQLKCIGGTTSTNTANGTVTVTVAAGQHVACTYVNSYSPGASVSSSCTAPYVDTFGTGTAGQGSPLPSGLTTYHYNSSVPAQQTNDGFYSVITRAQDAGRFAAANYDHTSGDGTGNMLFVNASYNPGIFYQKRFTNAVVGTPYTFSAWLLNVDNLAIRPNVTLQVVNPDTGAVLNSYNTGNIASYNEWVQYGFSFKPTTSEFILQVVNNSVGGAGNDLALDDISFGISCSPVTLTKKLGANRAKNTDQFEMSIRSGSATGPIVGTTDKAVTTGTGSTVTAGTGTTTVQQPIDTSVWLTEKGVGSYDASRYLGATIACTDPNGKATGLPNGPFTGSAKVDVVYGANISCTLTNTAKQPALTLTKTSTSTAYAKAGDQVPYSFVVTNLGNQTINGITIADVQQAPATQGNLSAISCGPSSTTGDAAGSLSPGAKLTCTATYTVTQADVDHGSLTDVATASGMPDDNFARVTSNQATLEVPAAQGPKLDIVKSTSTAAVTAAGQKIDYSFKVTNSGNVTLNNVGVIDVQQAPASQANLTAVSCPVTTLAPGASTTCTASYTTTQADVDNGSIKDTATATGTPAGSTTPITSDPSSLTVPVTLNQSISIAKSTPTKEFTAAGQKIDYSFEVTNTGNVTLSKVSVTDVQQAPASQSNLTAISCGPSSAPGDAAGTLSPGAKLTCTASYTTTQADVDNGSVKDTATAQGTPPKAAGPIVSAPSSVTVPATRNPAIAVAKSSTTTSVTAAGQRVSYSFAVTNTGNVTLSNIAVADQQVAPAVQGNLSAITCGQSSAAGDAAGTLSPGARMTCTATYTVTQADIDNGSIKDSATASGTPVGGGQPVTSAPSELIVPVAQNAAIAVKKSTTVSNVAAAGVALPYSFLVTNIGNVTLTKVSVQDVQQAPASQGNLSNFNCGPSSVPGDPAGTLSPGATMTCTATYTTTQADIDHGSITDSATAKGMPPSGNEVSSPPSTVTVPATKAPGLSIAKSTTVASYKAVGDKVPYSFVVTNTGNVTVSSIAITDVQEAPASQSNLSAIACPVTSLAPGASTTCTATYTVTQADLNNGSLADRATATGKTPGGESVTTPASRVVIPAAQSPALTVKKSSPTTSVSAAGQTIAYSFLVTNTGNVTMSNVSVADVQQAPASQANLTTVQCGPSSTTGDPALTLSPGASLTCTASYTVTQADLDHGSVKDVATASATPPGSATPVASPPSELTVGVTQNAAITLKKTSSVSNAGAAGATLPYSFVVTNTGNVTLTDVSVADVQQAPATQGNLSAMTCGPSSTATDADGTLSPGASRTCTATYTVTQADIDHGSITDTATAKGTPPGGNQVSSPPSQVTVPAKAAPGLAVVKSTTLDSFSAVGQKVPYTFVVSNTGNVTLKGITVTDLPLAPATGAALSPISCGASSTSADAAGTLSPGASMTCTATYTVTQADLDHGSLADRAAAVGTPPTGPAVTTPPSTVEIPAAQNPALRITKSTTTEAVTAAGQVIGYRFLVTNTGNVTLSGVSVKDVQQAPAGQAGLSAIDCPAATSLAPGASLTCTATYTTTQADIDHGSVTDVATATATPPGGDDAVVSPPSSVTVPVTQSPALTVKKTTSVSNAGAAGAKLPYTFVVTNTGNVTLTDVSVTDVQQAPASQGNLTAIECGPSTDADDAPGALSPGASLTCTATYTVTQADIDHGSIADTATAKGTPPGAEPITSPPSQVRVTAEPAPGLAAVKSTTLDSYSTVGQKVPYTFVVTNTGNVTLTGITIADLPQAPATDDALSAVTCAASSNPADAKGTLSPGATLTCTATYTVTQADLDHGSLANRATATGTPPTGPAVTTPPSSVEIPATRAPSLAIAKSTGTEAVTRAGQVVDYRFVVTNTGNVTLTGVALRDVQQAPASQAGLSAIDCGGVTSLAPGAKLTCTASYTATQADIDHGSITDVATVSATPPGGDAVTSPPSQVTVPVTRTPALTVTKTSSATNVGAAGVAVPYSFLVTNTGNTTLTDVSVSDVQADPATQANLSAIECGPSSEPGDAARTLSPGASLTCTATYTSTQADIDHGSITDTATAQGTPPGAAEPVLSTPSTVTVPAKAAPGLALSKSSSTASYGAVGDTVDYTFVVTNTGNVTVKNVKVTDVQQAPASQANLSALDCPSVTELAPGASLTCTATYTVTQADLNHGSLADSATATATPPSGPAITTTPSKVEIPADQRPALTVAKTSSTTAITKAGQVVPYSFVVTNTGNVTLTGIRVDDVQQAPASQANLSEVTCGPSSTTGDAKGTLSPGAKLTCTATYTVTQADMDHGSLSDSATATGTQPDGESVVSPPVDLTIDADRSPAITVKKTSSATNVAAAGVAVPYSFVVTNTGNVTLTNVSLKDVQQAPADQSDLSAIDCGPSSQAGDAVGTLSPGASLTCTATYTSSQADIDHGSITDTATATGTPPGGEPVVSPPSTVTVAATKAPGLAVAKSTTSTSYAAVGEKVAYSFAVTNTGNVTLSGLTVTDTQLAPASQANLSAVSCAATSLAPGAGTTCTATYTVTQADLDHGRLADSATATATPPGGAPVTTAPSTVVIPAAQAPALTVKKAATTQRVTKAGQSVGYTFVVTNTGNVTLSDVSVNDTQLAPASQANLSDITCQPSSVEGDAKGTLSPGATMTCSATYTATQADIDHGSITDTATAQGTPPGADEPVVSPPSSVTVPVDQTPALTVKKSSPTTAVTKAGQVIAYSFLVTNTGNVTLSGVGVSDVQQAPASQDGLSALSCGPSSAAGDADGTLSPGATLTCTATYTTTQADIDHGSITDTATAQGTPPGADKPVTSSPSTVTVPVTGTPGLKVVKTASVTSFAAVGQQVDYTFTVTNTGNLTLTGIGVKDGQQAPASQANLSEVTCRASSLAPGDSTTCSASYTVTQADLDHGSLTDSATATGTPPSGDPVTSTPSVVTIPAAQKPALSVQKTSTTAEVTAVGQKVSYSFVVTNTGNVTVSGVKVTDTQQAPAVQTNLSALDCGPSSLAGDAAGVLSPGATLTCTATYTVTQADLDHGSITDTATAQGTPPGADEPVVSPPSSVSVPVDQAPALTVKKSSATASVTKAGQQVSYSFVVTNTGNVTLTGVRVNDVQQAPASQANLSAIACGASSVEGDAAGTLSPGASVTCTATYTASQADVDHGRITDTATAQGTPPGADEPVVSPPSSVTVPVERTPALTVKKTSPTASVTKADQTVAYSFVVTNTGNVTISGVGVNDVQQAPASQANLSALDCGPSSVKGDAAGVLSPGASLTCTASYTVTQADVDHGSITDTATVSGTTPGSDEPVVSPPSSVSVPVEQSAGLSIKKTSQASNVAAAGAKVPYSFVVTNTGNVTLTGVQVKDLQQAPALQQGLGELTCGPSSQPGDADGTLSPGASLTCTATYTASQADIDHGSITDTATAQGTPPGADEPVTSTPSTVTVPATKAPGLSIVKSTTTDSFAAVGEKVEYSFVVTNTGNVTVADVSVTDVQRAPASQANLSAVACPVASLAPGASTTCAATYTVTQADLDHGSLADSATASGTPAGGEPITTPPSTVEIPAAQQPSVTVKKSTATTAVTKVGQKIDYSFEVTNTGNVTLSDIEVDDRQQAPASQATLSAVECGPSSTQGDAAGTLSPGATLTCTATYTVTQADLDHGSITDLATAQGTPPGADRPVVSEPSRVSVPVTQSGGLTVVKSGKVAPLVSAGDLASYTFVVTNTGNVTLAGVKVTDVQQAPATQRGLSAVSCRPSTVASDEAGVLSPGASMTCTATYRIAAADLQHGSVTDVATAGGTTPGGKKVVSKPSSVTLQLTQPQIVEPPILLPRTGR